MVYISLSRKDRVPFTTLPVISWQTLSLLWEIIKASGTHGHHEFEKVHVVKQHFEETKYIELFQ